jgi:hypothetical protein
MSRGHHPSRTVPSKPQADFDDSPACKKGALLSEVIVGAAVVCLTIGLQSAPARSSGRAAEQAPAAAGSCPKGSVAARIGGKRRCLRAGQRCKKRFERQYRRHGFHCQAGRLRKLRKHPHPPPPPPHRRRRIPRRYR